MHPREKAIGEALLCIQRGLPLPKDLSERLKDLDINIHTLLKQERYQDGNQIRYPDW